MAIRVSIEKFLTNNADFDQLEQKHKSGIRNWLDHQSDGVVDGYVVIKDDKDSTSGSPTREELQSSVDQMIRESTQFQEKNPSPNQTTPWQRAMQLVTGEAFDRKPASKQPPYSIAPGRYPSDPNIFANPDPDEWEKLAKNNPSILVPEGGPIKIGEKTESVSQKNPNLTDGPPLLAAAPKHLETAPKKPNTAQKTEKKSGSAGPKLAVGLLLFLPKGDEVKKLSLDDARREISLFRRILNTQPTDKNFDQFQKFLGVAEQISSTKGDSLELANIRTDIQNIIKTYSTRSDTVKYLRQCSSEMIEKYMEGTAVYSETQLQLAKEILLRSSSRLSERQLDQELSRWDLAVAQEVVANEAMFSKDLVRLAHTAIEASKSASKSKSETYELYTAFYRVRGAIEGIQKSSLNNLYKIDQTTLNAAKLIMRAIQNRGNHNHTLARVVIDYKYFYEAVNRLPANDNASLKSTFPLNTLTLDEIVSIERMGTYYRAFANGEMFRDFLVKNKAAIEVVKKARLIEFEQKVVAAFLAMRKALNNSEYTAGAESSIPSIPAARITTSNTAQTLGSTIRTWGSRLGYAGLAIMAGLTLYEIYDFIENGEEDENSEESIK